MSDQETTTPEEGGAVAAAAPTRRFVFNGMDLPDMDPSMSADQIRDIWGGTYPALVNAKVKGPEKDDKGVQVYTFVQNVGKLG